MLICDACSPVHYGVSTNQYEGLLLQDIAVTNSSRLSETPSAVFSCLPKANGQVVLRSGKICS